MQTDTSNHAQAMEFLFLFHACKLTNNRPDQSVSLADVARVADLSQDQSEQLCTSLREARLIRYSSLLGDISVTRFGVSEVVTTKACPHSGANYFPAVRNMGLRFSRGHHLFDDLQLSHIKHHDSDQTDCIVNHTTSQPEAGHPSAGHPEYTQWNGGGDKNSSQIRQEVIRELEHLLGELSEETGQSLPQTTRLVPQAQSPQLRPQASFFRGSVKEPAKAKPRFAEQDVTKTPSLLLNPRWKSVIKTQQNDRFSSIGPVAVSDKKVRLKARIETQPLVAAAGRDEADVTTGIEHLHDLIQRWCQTVYSKKTPSSDINSCANKYASGFISDLENLNESLFNFA